MNSGSSKILIKRNKRRRESKQNDESFNGSFGQEKGDQIQTPHPPSYHTTLHLPCISHMFGLGSRTCPRWLAGWGNYLRRRGGQGKGRRELDVIRRVRQMNIMRRIRSMLDVQLFIKAAPDEQNRRYFKFETNFSHQQS